MFPFRKILLPVDYSDPCRSVVPHVREMARVHSAQVALVHAYQVPFQIYADSAVLDPLIPEETRTAEQNRLRAFASEMFPGEAVETFVDLGDPAVVIHDFVHRQGADLIMLSTHGRGPFRRFLLGSIVAKILHDVSVPVWTGTKAALAGRAPGSPHRSVLCALQDNEDAAGVMKAAAAFAAQQDARLSIVHVLEAPSATEYDFGPIRQKLINDANEKLRELTTQLGIDAAYAVVDDALTDGIHKEAQRRNADIIVVGRGRVQGLASRAWSSLYSIIRDAPCPVLSI